MNISKKKLKQNLYKQDIVLSVCIGISSLFVLLIHEWVINFFLKWSGNSFKNEHENLTILFLFLITPFAAGFVTFKLNKPKPYSFDKTIVIGLIAALTFIISIVIPTIFWNQEFSLALLLGVLFFSTLFSFIIAALNATLLAKLLTIRTANSK